MFGDPATQSGGRATPGGGDPGGRRPLGRHRGRSLFLEFGHAHLEGFQLGQALGALGLIRQHLGERIAVLALKFAQGAPTGAHLGQALGVVLARFGDPPQVAGEIGQFGGQIAQSPHLGDEG
jgi:hypothetical protein